ncbi:MAG: hypothetical protein ACR2HJ_05365 [Fimbriimonadales bacterium]
MSSSGRESRPLSADEIAGLERDMPKLLDEMRETGELPPNPDRLTPSEIEELKRIGHEQSQQARKAFAHLRSKAGRSEE